MLTNEAEGNSEATQITASPVDNFWDIGSYKLGYKRVVKRLDDGATYCTNYIKMLNERAEIEAIYAKKLLDWARKWDDIAAKDSEHGRRKGTLENAWKVQLKEAKRMAECHLNCQRSLQEEVVPVVSRWKNENYHSCMALLQMIFHKETKKAEDNFQAAQKPWEKKMQKVEKNKKAYYSVGKQMDSQQRTVNLLETNNDMYDRYFQAKEKLDRCKAEVEKCREKYRHKVADLKQYHSKYRDDMSKEFERCQQLERKRMEFFKQAFNSYMEAVKKLIVDPRYGVTCK